MAALVFLYLLMTQKCLERNGELVTQRREEIRCAKLLLCGIRARISQLMVVASCMVANQQGRKQRQDVRQYVKATEGDQELDKLFLASNRCFNRESNSIFARWWVGYGGF